MNIVSNPSSSLAWPEAISLVDETSLAQAHPKPDQAEKVAKDFESVLLHKVMEAMQQTIPESDFLSSGATRQVQGIFWMYMAQEVSQSGGIGLWKDIYRQITQMDPVDSSSSTMEQIL
jgi:Rod binding domain-containing protein